MEDKRIQYLRQVIDLMDTNQFPPDTVPGNPQVTYYTVSLMAERMPGQTDQEILQDLIATSVEDAPEQSVGRTLDQQAQIIDQDNSCYKDVSNYAIMGDVRGYEDNKV